jgi:glutathione S-transferase
VLTRSIVPSLSRADPSSRQFRKVNGGLRQLNIWVSHRKGKYIIGNQLTVADLAAGSFLGWFAIRWPDHEWKTQYPELKRYHEQLEDLEVFKNTRPSPQTMKDKVV